jgi:hypothetical protein
MVDVRMRFGPPLGILLEIGKLILVSTPGLATRHNWPLRRDLRKVHRLYPSNFRVSTHQITPVILLFDPLIAHSNYMVTGLKNLVSYR